MVFSSIVEGQLTASSQSQNKTISRLDFLPKKTFQIRLKKHLNQNRNQGFQY